MLRVSRVSSVIILIAVLLIASVVCGKAEYNLSVTVADGHGQVTPSSGALQDGTVVTITAIPDSGWDFSHWECGGWVSTDNPLIMTMDSDKRVEAFFNETVLPTPTPTPSSTISYSYYWYTGPWSVCSAPCGGGVQTRHVVCTRTDSEIIVDDSYCPSARPATSQACNTQDCPTQPPTATATSPTHG